MKNRGQNITVHLYRSLHLVSTVHSTIKKKHTPAFTWTPISYQIWYFAESTCLHLQKGEMILFKVTLTPALNEWHFDYIFLFFSICFERTLSLSRSLSPFFFSFPPLSQYILEKQMAGMNSSTCHSSFCIGPPVGLGWLHYSCQSPFSHAAPFLLPPHPPPPPSPPSSTRPAFFKTIPN